jgi:tetratricopeptide (TPR) repeat protein
MAQADRFESLLPKAGHVVHMPSHIYVRVGQYERAIESNRRSLDVDQLLSSAWGERKLPSLGTYGMSHRTHGRHALDFMRYASMLQGNYTRTLEAARAAAAGQTHMGAAGAHRLHTTVWLVHKVFGKWDAVLAEPAPQSGSAYVDGLWSYVRGSAFVGRGELEKAEHELVRLRVAGRDPTIKTQLTVANPTQRILELAARGLEGELSLARRDYGKAIVAFQAAVRLQNTLSYIEPPDWGQSMRLYLGAALLKAGRPREAEKVYREDLGEFRENGWALFGLWQSLRDQGKNREASKVRARFDRAWKHADITLSASVL